MKIAMNLENLSSVLVKTNEKNVRALFPGMTVESGNGSYTIKTPGEVVRLSCPTAKMLIELTLPERMLPGLDAKHPRVPFTKEDMELLLQPYDSDFSKRIAMSVIHKERARYGIVSGSYCYDGNTLRVEIGYDPAKSNAVILYSEEPIVMSYANTHRRAAFALGDSGIYAVILPFNYLVELGKVFPGYSEWKLRNEMAYNLATYLERFGYRRTIEAAG